MKCQTSFYNKSIIKSDFKLYGFISILYTIAIFIVMPLGIILSYNNTEFTEVPKYYMYNVLELISFPNSFDYLMVFTVPVILGLLLFRYVQNTKSISKLHSLPITRNQLFRSHIISGTIMYSVPIIINTIILLLVMKSYNLFSDEFGIYVTDLLIWCVGHILVGFVMLCFTVLMGMVLGSSVLQAVITYIVAFIPMVFDAIIPEFINKFLYGYSIYSLEFSKFSPFHNIEYFTTKKSAVILFIIYAIAFYLLAKFFYNKRDLEKNNEFICFKFIKHIFVYGVTFSAMLLLGLFISSEFSYRYSISMGRLYLGSILGAIIGYSIAQMIANKTFKVYKYYKGLVFYGIAICLLIVGMKVDIIGYEKYVPNVDEVKSIEFDYSRYHNTIFETKENIDSIIDLHKSLVQSNDRRTPYLDGKHRYYINYTMKNGKKITRNYNINTFFDKKIKGILESTEYKTKSIPLLNVDKDKIISVVLGTRLFDSQDYIVSNREEIAELLSICKLDLWDETYEYIDKHDGNSYISFTVLKEKDDDSKEDDKNYYIEIPIKLNNKRMVEWIKKKGLEDKFILTPNNVDNITITEQIWGHYKSVDKSPDKIITNKEEIKELIELQSEDFNYRKNQIVYIIEYSNSYFHKQVKIDKEDLPSKFDKYINR